VMKSNDEIWH